MLDWSLNIGEVVVHLYPSVGRTKKVENRPSVKLQAACSSSRLLVLIISSLRLAIHRHLSIAPSTGRNSYFALASMSLSRLLTMVAVVR